LRARKAKNAFGRVYEEVEPGVHWGISERLDLRVPIFALGVGLSWADLSTAQSPGEERCRLAVARPGPDGRGGSGIAPFGTTPSVVKTGNPPSARNPGRLDPLPGRIICGGSGLGYFRGRSGQPMEFGFFKSGFPRDFDQGEMWFPQAGAELRRPFGVRVNKRAGGTVTV